MSDILPIPLPTNVVHCGDNLGILKAIPSASIDLVYLDPPFASGREHSGRCRSTGKVMSFDDRFPSLGAYVDFMRPRCVELHRVLARTGSLFLHCDDSAASHLAIMLDEVFGADNLQNEIVWKRSSAHNGATKGYGRVHDTIFFYSRSPDYVFNPPADGVGDLWGDLWDDIRPINGSARERTGYPTQKPVALLERIIRAGSNPGSVVLDPFCGSGTTLRAAENLGRRWIGVDGSEDACRIARGRLPIEEIAPFSLVSGRAS